MANLAVDLVAVLADRGEGAGEFGAIQFGFVGGTKIDRFVFHVGVQRAEGQIADAASWIEPIQDVRETIGIPGIKDEGQAKLADVVGTNGCAGRFFASAERRQHQAGQDGDDGDDHEQLDERKSWAWLGRCPNATRTKARWLSHGYPNFGLLHCEPLIAKTASVLRRTQIL